MHISKNAYPRKCDSWLNVVAVRRWLIYKPLAILLSILMAPAISWMERGGASDRPFAASGQTVSGACTGGANTIIQNYCDAAGKIYGADLVQLESDAVNGYLAEHDLPSTDANVIYQYGRSDLRSAIRAHLMALLVGYINIPAASRTAHQQSVIKWFQSLVGKNEIANYQNAVNQYETWVADPCLFTLDPEIAQQYNLKYDGTPWCGSSLAAVINPDLGVPAESYFTTYGMVSAYGAVGNADPNYGVVMSETSINLSTVFAVLGVASGVIASAIATGSLAAGLPAIISITTATVIGFTANPLQGALPLISTVTTTILPATMVLVPIAIILAAVAIGVSAGFEAFSYADELNDLNGLKVTLSQLMTTPPDLAAMASDSTGQGMFKLQNTLLAQTLSGVCPGSTSTASPASVPCSGATPADVPSTIALPAHRAGKDLPFVVPNSSSTQESFSYQDWNGAVWTVGTWNGWFVQTCVAGTPQTYPNGATTTGACVRPNSITADLQFIDWSIPPDPSVTGDRGQWTASRFGSNFILAKGVSGTNEQPCPANQLTGLTSLPSSGNFFGCSTYVNPSAHPIGGNGTFVQMQLAPYSVPTFPAPYYFSFTVGQSGSQLIQPAGAPTPTVTVNGGTLTSDTDFTIAGSGTTVIKLGFQGSPAAAAGSYTLTLNALGYSGAVQSQSYTINVGSGLAITSPGTLNGQQGVPVNFLVTTTGVPFPKISADPNLKLSAQGLTLTDHGNGTATISGTPPYGSLGYQCISTNNNNAPCGIIASNANGTVEQEFVTSFSPPPPAMITGPLSATFNAGIQNQAQVVSTGASTAVTWTIDPTISAPSWVKFKDNGNGTGTISGVPPVGTTGTFNIGLLVSAYGSGGSTGGTFTITVVNNPLITSGNSATFTVGSAGVFQISASQGTISVPGTLPSGLSFFSGSTVNCLTCQASISGTPAAGTGGQYALQLSTTASSNVATQNLILNVYEAPEITSPTQISLYQGQLASIAVTAAGYPSTSSHAIAANSGPPTSASEGNGMYFTISGLPKSLSARNLNSLGLATGTLTITGTPLAADLGAHTLQITAQNGVGTPAQQTLTLQVSPPAGTPTVSYVVNNSSDIPAGFPNSGVTPGSIIQIGGTNLADPVTGTLTLQNTQQSGGIPLTLGEASVSVSVGSTTVTPAMYYATPTAIAAVLPSSTPVGSGTLTVTYKGAASQAFPITIVQSAWGTTTYDGNLAVVQDAVSGALINYTNSAAPNQIVVAWGTAGGASPSDSDTAYTGHAAPGEYADAGVCRKRASAAVEHGLLRPHGLSRSLRSGVHASSRRDQWLLRSADDRHPA